MDTVDDDPRWAADRLNSIKEEYVATGLFYDQDGNETKITSGEDSDADRVAEILRQVGAPFPPNDMHPAAAHVEAKVAARMRDNDIAEGMLVINNRKGCATASTVAGAF